MHGPARRDTGHRDVAARMQPGTTLTRPVSHQPPGLRYLPRCPHDPDVARESFSLAIRRPMQTFRYSRSPLHRHSFLRLLDRGAVLDDPPRDLLGVAARRGQPGARLAHLDGPRAPGPA